MKRIIALFFVATGIFSTSLYASAEDSFIAIKDVTVVPSVAAEGSAMPLVVSASVSSIYGIEAVSAELGMKGVSIATVSLFDDGAHGDGAANDERWAGTVSIEDLLPGSYSVAVQARNRRGGQDLSGGHSFIIEKTAPAEVPLVGTGEGAAGSREEYEAFVRDLSDSEGDELEALIDAQMGGAPLSPSAASSILGTRFECSDSLRGYQTSCVNDSAVLSWRAPSNRYVCTAGSDLQGSLADRWTGAKKWTGAANLGAIVTATSTFRLTCVGPADETASTVVIAPKSRDPQPSLFCQNESDGTFTKGPCVNSRAVLRWGPSPDSSSCMAEATPLSSGWRGRKSAQGMQSVGEVKTDTLYSLTCSNRRGTATESVTVRPNRKKALPLVQKGKTAAKLDVLFVSEGFTTQAEADGIVREIYAKGFSSYSPFREQIDEINVWTVRGEELYVPKPEVDLYDAYDNQYAYVQEARRHNPFADEVIFLSAKTFRSYAYLFGDAFVSYGSSVQDAPFVGTTPFEEVAALAMHEFGHSFGGLADEYVEPAFGDVPTDPNCLDFNYVDFSTLPSSWLEADETGHKSFTQRGAVTKMTYYSFGCSYVFDNIRPTIVGTMRSQYGGGTPYGPINEDRLLSLLLPYKKDPLVMFAPKGGESWEAGTRQVIRWVSKPETGGIRKIELLPSSGPSTALFNNSSKPDTDGVFVFTVPSVRTGSYRVRITSAGGTNTAVSTPFSIVPAFVGTNRALSGLCILPHPSYPENLVTQISPGTATIRGNTVSFAGEQFFFGSTGSFDFYLRRDPIEGTVNGEIYYSGANPDLKDRVKIATVQYVDSGQTYFGIPLGKIDTVKHSISGCSDIVPSAGGGSGTSTSEKGAPNASPLGQFLRNAERSGLPRGVGVQLPRPKILNK